ncbi:MAG: metallophosphoesterase family protein [Candidatus Zixiibacteriota bacterium]
MKLALISDIHGNLEALVSVLNHIEKQKVDKIYCLGDVIGYGSDPVSCLELVGKNCDVKLMGNHEYTALGLTGTDDYNPAARKSSDWTREQLTDREQSIIAEYEMIHPTGDILLVHASPHQPDQWHYIMTPDAARKAFDSFSAKLCFYGHSHVPQIFCEREPELPRMQVGHDFLPDEEGRYLINVGSVGQPRDNDARACYAIFDTDEYEVLYHRVEYDIETTQEKMTQAKLPRTLVTRLSAGR